jgi:hypothetical protein
MALVNIESAIKKVLNALKKTPPGQGWEILSYKRNRGVAVIKEAEGTFWVRERGYQHQEWQVDERQLPRLLKGIVKREFPRSRKLRIYAVADRNDLGRPRKVL